MILRDVSLSLVYIPNLYFVEEYMREKETSYEDACRVDYQANWNPKRYQFSQETRCIASFFCRVLPKVVTHDCKKIIIECVPKIEYKEIRNLSGVYKIQRLFDYEAFKDLLDYNKKVATFEMMKDSVLTVVSRMQWDLQPFKDALKHIVESNYHNVWVWRKKMFNPSRCLL